MIAICVVPDTRPISSWDEEFWVRWSDRHTSHRWRRDNRKKQGESETHKHTACWEGFVPLAVGQTPADPSAVERGAILARELCFKRHLVRVLALGACSKVTVRYSQDDSR